MYMWSLPHYSQNGKLVPNCPSEYTMKLWNKIGNDDGAKKNLKEWTIIWTASTFGARRFWLDIFSTFIKCDTILQKKLVPLKIGSVDNINQKVIYLVHSQAMNSAARI